MAKKGSGPVGEILLAAISVLLGFVLWVIVRQGDTVTKAVPMAVVHTGVPPMIEIESIEPKTLLVSFTMKKADEDLARAADQFRATIDLSDIGDEAGIGEAMDIKYIVTQQQLRYPQELDPSTGADKLEVTIRARVRTTEAKVVPRFTPGNPPEGYYVDRERIELGTETVQVAVSRMPAPGEEVVIETMPIDVAGRTETLVGDFDLDYDETRGIFPLPRRKRESISIVVPILERTEERRFSDIEVQYQPIKQSVRADLSPRTVDVAISGPQSIVGEITREMLKLSPKPNQALDNETPGLTVDCAIELKYEGLDEKRRSRLKATLAPSVVVVRFSSSDERAPLIPLIIAPTEAAPTPTPAAPSAP